MEKGLSAQKKFILLYRAALESKISREQLGEYIGMQPHSIVRKRLKIKDKFGTDLPQLPSSENSETSEMTDEEFNRFNEAYKKLYADARFGVSVEVRNEVKTYVVTSAQNATPVHQGFLESINTYCEATNAELLVIPFRYRNPTSLWTDKDHEWWHQDIHEFMVEHNIKLCDGLQVMGHIKIQPTAITPLSGFDSYTGTDSGIFGHPKVQFKTIPTPSKSLPKLLSTTGAITIPNYSDSKAGHKGEFHHSLSAVVVDVTKDEFHLRHIHAEDDTGAFYDLNKYYMPDSIEDSPSCSALVTGDTHIEFLDTDVDKATYTNSDSIVNMLNPEYIVYHDLQDFYSRNHHHRGNDIISIGKHRYGRNNVEEGMQQAADFIDRNTRTGTKSVIVKSNHDEAFDRWLREADPKTDDENAQFYYYMKYHMVKNIEPTPTGFKTIDPFEFWCKNPDEFDGLSEVNETIFLSRDESFAVNEIELGFHGDAGPNGSRGSINSLSKIGPKIVIGHSHTPGIIEGVYQVGLSARKDLEYCSGPSSWLQTHCVVYPNGARTLINIINGKWKG